jgi:tetratricopeptide (TPR) repeat protein
VEEAIAQYEQAMSIQPGNAIVHYKLGVLCTADGKLSEAITHYREALRLKPDYANACNNLAWLLATSEGSSAGDHEQAIEVAMRANELAEGKDPGYLDTLAVAYAAADRFPEAVNTAQKAIDLARSIRQPELAGQIESRLELYRSGRVYRESVPISSPQNP